MEKKNKEKASKRLWIICALCVLTTLIVVVLLIAIGGCTHLWGDWKITTPSTCLEKGTQQHQCIKCGEIETKELELADHTHPQGAQDCTKDTACTLCGEVLTPARQEHTGGTPVCGKGAVCEVCGQEYGDPGAHIPGADDGDCTTAVACTLCGGVAVSAKVSHTGGSASCDHLAECDVCGKQYGSLAAHTPGADDGDCTTAVDCLICGVEAIAAKECHTGGTATCERRARCTVCTTEYGDLAEHVPFMDDGDCTTDLYCSNCWSVITPAKASHTGGVATCEKQAECEICGKKYGNLAAHTPHEDDGSCLTEVCCIVCGTVTTPAQQNHLGGMATCEHKAICAICGTAYGEFAPHIPDNDDGDCTTAVHCSICHVVTTPGKAGHTGGKASCDQQAHCSECGTAYGELAPHTPGRDDGNCATPIMCIYCSSVAIPGKDHTGGTATCSKKAVCDICGLSYGSYAPHTPYADDGDCTTHVYCMACGAIAVPAQKEHTGGTALCGQRAECALCGKQYGPIGSHTPSSDDGDCTTAIVCVVCGEVTTPANAHHTGGTATCEHKAQCSVCHKEYGDFAPHAGPIIWIRHLNSHYQVYSCCYVKASESAGHSLSGGACSQCGFHPTITVTSVEVTPGQTQVQIAISVANNPEITGLMIKLDYNESVFVLTGAQSGAALDGLTFTAPGKLQSGSTFLWDGVHIDDKDIKEGEILILTFTISASAPAGEYTLALKITAYDNDLNPYLLIIEGGKVTVTND